MNSLGSRMKEYESITDNKLMSNMPIIIRLDGRAFHTFTKGLKKPFDDTLNNIMTSTMKYLCENISNCIFGYTQSDEITLVVYKKSSETWFDNRIQKIASVVASMATLKFCKEIEEHIKSCFDGFGWNIEESELWAKKHYSATFDARVFNIPEDEIINNIIWRQQDASKNSVSSLAQSQFNHKQLLHKNTSEMQDMLMIEKGINWNDLPIKYKRGVCCKRDRLKWVLDYNMPILTENRGYLQEYIRKQVYENL